MEFILHSHRYKLLKRSRLKIRGQLLNSARLPQTKPSLEALEVFQRGRRIFTQAPDLCESVHGTIGCACIISKGRAMKRISQERLSLESSPALGVLEQMAEKALGREAADLCGLESFGVVVSGSRTSGWLAEAGHYDGGFLFVSTF